MIIVLVVFGDLARCFEDDVDDADDVCWLRADFFVFDADDDDEEG